MNYEQLLTPNLDPVIRINGQTLNDWLGWCLGYVVTAFNTPLAGPTAWYAWSNTTKKRHFDRNLPSGVYVPIWFSHFGNYDGTGTKNWGHVAIYKDGKVWSSPISHKPYADTWNSIADVERMYSSTFVGWSEDVAGIDVIKQGDNMATPREIDLVHKGMLGRNPTSEELQNKDYAANTSLLIETCYNAGADFRARAQAYDELKKTIADLSQRPTKVELQETVDKLNAQIKELESIPPVVQTVIDPELNTKLDWIIAKLKTLQGMISNLFKIR